jgi:hypothetical protein
MTSRLAGIRKLLVSLGRRSLAQDAAYSVKDSGFEPRLERTTVGPAYTDPGPLEGGASEGHSASPARVTVRPEILRPKPVVQADKEKEPLRPTVPQPLREKADTHDEIETLPSVRGQYRKKRYPPI